MAIDESSLPQTRTDGSSLLPLILQMLQFDDVIPHIAHRGHAAGNVEHSVQGLGVSMHVEQPRKNRLTGSIDTLGVGGRMSGTCGTDTHESVSRYNHCLIFPHDGLFGVEQAHVLDRDRVCWMLRQVLRQVRVSLVTCFSRSMA